MIHITGTWFWANLFHPFVMYFYFSGNYSEPEPVGTLFQIFIYSLVFSLPSLFTSLLVSYLVCLLRATTTFKYVIWLIAAPIITCLNFLLIFGGLTGNLNSFEFQIAVPAMISVVIVILLRYRSFFAAIDGSKKEEHENDMV